LGLLLARQRSIITSSCRLLRCSGDKKVRMNQIMNHESRIAAS
jgi:hypothetical protein